MPPFLRNLLAITAGVLVVAASVWAVQEHQRVTVERSLDQTEAVQGMLTGMLDRETALRGYLLTGERTFLDPHAAGERGFERALRDLRRTGTELPDDAQSAIDRSEALASRWDASGDEAIMRARLTGSRRVPIGEALHRKRTMDALRGENATLHTVVESERRRDLAVDQRLAVALVVLLAAVFGSAGWLLLVRPATRARALRARDAARREFQSRFSRTLQLVDTEHEAHELVRRHLEGTQTATAVVVLQRNNSADRLVATTDVDPASPLTEALVDAEPRSCLAVRLGREHAQQGDRELLSCELCGALGTERALCTPLVVSGEVIGSVLVGHEEPMAEDCAEIIGETVTQAAPALANMRNLAIAEERASTDALTGLANRRSVHDTLRRMVAQAQRTATQLAVIAVDVDHFKRINDRLGHDRGDDVLAAVGQTLGGTLRASDFVGRQGGEEFVALLPDTGLDGALTAAENLRAAIEALDVLGADQVVTASFGVAVLPEDGSDGPALLRQADRALYAAKAAGRNRVETAASGAGAHALSPETAG